MMNENKTTYSGSIKKAGDMKGKVCLFPFINIHLYSNYKIYSCCSSWSSLCIGDFSRYTIKELWNGKRIREIRESILNGSFLYCNWHQCPFYTGNDYPVYNIDDLRNPDNLSPAQRLKVKRYSPWIKYILEGKTELGLLPANYNIDYDETCNLACPSCRKELKVYNDGPEYEKRVRIHSALFKEIGQFGLEKVRALTFSGSGEVFMSKIFTSFLSNLNGSKYPGLEINLMSNGQLFTKQAWSNLSGIHNNINEVIISLDASCEKTYGSVRKNGSFQTLLSNLDFLSSLREDEKIRCLMLSYIVQLRNFKEMVEAVKIAKEYNVDRLLFSLLTNWGTWPLEVFETHAVWKKYHPNYKDFLEVLQDPVFDDPVVEPGNMAQYRVMSCKKEDVPV